ncbi:uncharacterized mitochondrial protein AtMg00810-like [Nicotiana sylvestris]|uniref:uncharacterized mitochondrial protein AtMg00810-like n=1 Tax=Nicotiana sylvestris TaxID=4096 RepID=UPI00388C715E
MKIIREPQGFIINQRKFTLELLEEFGFSGVAVSSPLDPSSKLHLDLSPPLADPAIYRRLIGKLNYLTNTRPDICFVVLTLSQYMQKPQMLHLSTGMLVLRYLNTDPAQGILLSANPSLDLLAFCDADWAACKTSRRSVSGFFITLGALQSHGNRKGKYRFHYPPLRQNIAL